MPVLPIINLALLRHLIEDAECNSPYLDWWEFQSLLQGTRWVHDMQRFYSNSGGLWKPVEDAEVKSLFVKMSRGSFIPLFETVNATPDDTIIPQRDYILKGLKACRKHVSTDACVQHFMKAAKTHFLDSGFAARVDSVPHYLGTPDGIIDLRTGKVLVDPEDAFVSLSVTASFSGIDMPTPDVDAFFASVFDGDAQLIAFVQRWLGYSLTGETKAQKFGIFDGVGSNGKSLLVKLIQQLLGDYGGVGNKFVFFAKPEATSGPTPWLAALHKKRLVFVEEADAGDVVNVSLLKDITGGTAMQVRRCHQDPFNMPITHKQMLATNFIPRLDTAEASIRRRLLIIPLKMIYKGPHEFDARNSRHRPLDCDLASKLLVPAAQQQLLAWMVRGAVAWYAHADPTFDNKPAAIREAEADYIGETDLVQQFLEAHTQTKVGGMVLQREFGERLQAEHGRIVNVARKMEAKGFPRAQKKVNGVNTKIYLGLQWTLASDQTA